MSVVWLSMLASDDSAAAVRRACESSDPRLAQYWDPDKVSGRAWQHSLNLPRLAWDVYFVYAKDAAWHDVPPVPDYWQHQGVGTDTAPVLDQESLIAHVRELIAKK